MTWEEIQLNGTYEHNNIMHRVFGKFENFIITISWSMQSKAGMPSIIGKEYDEEDYLEWTEVTDWKITNMLHKAVYDGKILKF